MESTFVRRATLDDVKSVAERLRQADAEELRAVTGQDARAVLPLCAADGREILAAGLTSTDRPEILFGVDPVVGVERFGIVWLVGTDVIFDHPVVFVQRTREWLDKFHEDYDVLTNLIDERNTRHLQWLQWMGFKFIRRVPSFGAENRPFIEFVSVNLECV